MSHRLAALAVTLAVVAGAAQNHPPTPPVPPATAPSASSSPTTASATPAKPADLKVALMDGSLLTGRLSISEISMDTKFGTLKVPIEQINSFMPGLQSHPQFQQSINNWVNDLGADAFADRERAQQALFALGPEIRGELERQLRSAENEKAIRLQKIIDDFESATAGEEVDKSRVWLKDDVITTPGFTIVGRITTPGFAVTGSYGTVQIKMQDVREVRIQNAELEDIRKTLSITGVAITQHLYTNTGIKLAKGDQIVITATGSIGMPPWGNSQSSTPDGGSNFGTVQPGIFTGTLVGRVGESGPMIKIGSHLQWNADRAGVFQLGIAAQQDFQNYTFPGEYQVKIRVVRAQ